MMKKLICSAIIMALLLFPCIGYAGTIEDEIAECEKQISLNNEKIQSLDEIKTQLHITAELLRNNSYINDGFDELLSWKWFACENFQSSLLTENDEIENKKANLEAELEQEKSKRMYVGNFKITHYCPCTTCNGSWGSKTALGTTMTPNRTIAVDPKVIPLGSKVEIQGKTYIAEDTGGAIKGYRIDMCVASHSEAYAKGVKNNVPVYIIKD